MLSAERAVKGVYVQHLNCSSYSISCRKCFGKYGSRLRQLPLDKLSEFVRICRSIITLMRLKAAAPASTNTSALCHLLTLSWTHYRHTLPLFLILLSFTTDAPPVLPAFLLPVLLLPWLSLPAPPRYTTQHANKLGSVLELSISQTLRCLEDALDSVARYLPRTIVFTQ